MTMCSLIAGYHILEGNIACIFGVEDYQITQCCDPVMSAGCFQESCPTTFSYVFVTSLIVTACNKAAILNKILTSSTQI
jgi:hypothetical protein